MTAPRPPRVGILLFDGVEELDAVGPWEVLAQWAKHGALGAEVLTFSPDGAPVRCAKGMVITPTTRAADVGPLDALVHPGGPDARRLMTDDAHLAWLRSAAAATPLVASVCTGALVLAAAGLLTGRPATTHHGALGELAAADPTVDVRRGVRFVDDGDVVTSAGVTAGIDLALHLVARLDSPAAADGVRWGIEHVVPAPA